MQAHEIVKKMKNWKLPQLMFSQNKYIIIMYLKGVKIMNTTVNTVSSTW